MDQKRQSRAVHLQTLNRCIAIGNFAVLASILLLILSLLDMFGQIELDWLPGPGTAAALFVAGYVSSSGLSAMAKLVGVFEPLSGSSKVDGKPQ